MWFCVPKPTEILQDHTITGLVLLLNSSLLPIVVWVTQIYNHSSWRNLWKIILFKRMQNKYCVW
jgi:hypothetical protein